MVFDAGPLNHFALANELPALQQIVSDRRCVTTDAVREELREGTITHPQLVAVENLPWLEVVSLTTLGELYAFAEYMGRLGQSQRNAGEASVLAWAEVNDAVAFVDDQAACNVGRARGVTVYRTLNLVIRSHRAGHFSEQRAQEIIKALVDTGARFPQRARVDLFGWAREVGLL